MNFNNFQFERSFGISNQLPQSDKIEICFSGRSNVGKSSIVNRVLCRKNLARVSTKPGKTVTINFFTDGNIRLVDLPGYGYAKVDFKEKERWAELMEGYFGSGRNIGVVFQLVDMRHPVTDFDKDMLHFLKHYNILYCILLTKSDKLNKSEYTNRYNSVFEELGDLADKVEVVATSALKNDGIDRVQNIIKNIAEGKI